MPGDYSRTRYTPRSGYIAALEQQGRVRLDADGNEFAEAIDRRRRAETIDTIGHGVVPTATQNAFQILSPATGQYTIGQGRAYVDGILVDCWGDDTQDTFEADLGELLGTNPLAYTSQPFYYTPNFPVPAGAGTSIVYLDVWEREVTALDVWELPGSQAEYRSLIDPALEGIDTTTRVQVAWQVKALSLATAAVCSDNPPEWQKLIAPSTGVMTSGTTPAPSSASACVIDPSGGYTGLENRLYRVQIQSSGSVDVGPGAVATFVWSKDNASLGANLVSTITHISAMECQLSVTTVGRDKTFGFKVNDVLEVLDDFVEWSMRETNKGGTFVTVTAVDPEQLTINVTPDISATFTVVAARHPRIRKWEALPQPTNNGNAIALGSEGVTVTFGTTAAATLRAGDYWTFCARTATGTIEILNDAPPRGVLHHYMKLAVTNPPNAPQDCRVFWPPSFGGEGCCTVVVKVGDDIQKAIDSLPEQGGCVCLKAGTHVITTPINITQRSNILIHGESTAAVVQNSASAAVLEIGEAASDIAIERISLIGTPQRQEFNGVITIRTTVRCVVRDCKVRCIDSGAPPILPIAFLVRDANQLEFCNNFVSGVIVGLLAFDAHDIAVIGNNFAAITTVDPAGNTISGGAAGIGLLRPAGVVTIEANEVADFQLGVDANTSGLTGSGTLFPLQALITSNLIRRHLLLPGSGSSFGWTDPLGTLLQNKVYGISTDASGIVIEKNTVEIADPGHGGVLVFGSGAMVRDNSIPSSIQPPAAFDWASMPVGIVVYKPLAATAVDNCRVIGNSLTGPQKGIAILAELADLISTPVVERNRIVNGVTPESIDVTQPFQTIPALQTSLQSLNNAFGVLTINADRAAITSNFVSTCTVGIAAITLEPFFIVVERAFPVSEAKVPGSIFVAGWPRATVDGNSVDSSTVGVLAAGLAFSTVQNGDLTDNQLGICLYRTYLTRVAQNQCAGTGTGAVVPCLDLQSIDVCFQDNSIANGQTGLLVYLSRGVSVEGNTVSNTNSTGIAVVFCEGEIRVEHNSVENYGVTGQSAIEVNLIGEIDTWDAALKFGNGVSAGIAAAGCSGLVSVEDCEVREPAQSSAVPYLDLAVIANAHTRVRGCRVVRSHPGVGSSKAILVVPVTDQSDPSFMSVHVSGNHLDISVSPPAGTTALTQVDLGLPPQAPTGPPCDILFNDNSILQRGDSLVEPAVRLSGDILAITGNRIRSTMSPSLDIQWRAGLSYVGNVTTFPASINPTPGLFSNVHPDPTLSNVTG